MKYLEILRARLDEIAQTRSAAVERMTAAVAAAEVEQRSALNDAEEAEFATAKAEVTSLDAEADQVRSRIAELEKVEAGREAADAATRSAGFTVPNISRGRDPWDTSEIRFADRDQLHGQVRSALEAERTLTSREKESAERLLARDTRSGALAKRILITGADDYSRAVGKIIDGNEYGLTDKERSKLAEMRAASLTDGAGGYAVPFAMDPTVIDTNAGSVNPFRMISTVKTTVTDQWAGVSSAGVTASWDGEAAEVSDDAPTLVQPSISVHKAQAFVPFSIEIDQDWANSGDEFRTMFARARDNLEATAHATGSGSSQPYGVVTRVAALGSGASLVTPTTAETFAVADLYALEEALPARHRANASWAANKAIYNKIRQFGTSDSHALWERLGAGQPPALLGYNAYEASAMDGVFSAAATAATNYLLLLGDFSNYYIVDRVGMTVDLIPHLFATGNNRPSGQRGLYAYWRSGADVVNYDAFRMLNIATTA